MKKKILIVCDKNPCTSFGRLSLDFKEALKSSEFSSNILWLETPEYFPNGVSDGEDSLKAKSLSIGFFTYKKPFMIYLKQKTPDIVLFIRPELGFLCPIAKKTLPKSKTIVMVHDTFAETLYPNSLKFKILNKFFINPTKTADTYIYNSHYTEQESNAFFGVPKIPGTIVGCPISKGFLEPFEDISPDSKKLFWERFGIKNFNAVCLNISLDEPRKNLKTFFQLAKEKPELAFVRVGRLRKETHDLIQTMNLKNLFHFENLDFSTLRNFYRNASVFIYPSFLEGFGLPPLEALASKIPVISSKTSALEENLNGIVPLITPPDNIKECINTLDLILSGKIHINQEEKNALLNKFSPESFTEKFLTYLRKIS
jgi:glycosyltransferase involved in cell wall biosynthesis